MFSVVLSHRMMSGMFSVVLSHRMMSGMFSVVLSHRMMSGMFSVLLSRRMMSGMFFVLLRRLWPPNLGNFLPRGPVSTSISLDFNGDVVNRCPKGWSCWGHAAVWNSSSVGGAEGSYFSMGGSYENGSANSTCFILPTDVVRVSLQRCGGANAEHGGFFVVNSSNGATLCSATNGENTWDMQSDECPDLEVHAGHTVYMRVVAYYGFNYGQVFIDTIVFENNNSAALMISALQLVTLYACRQRQPALLTFPRALEMYKL
ncbi:hypothetical protein CYMTET_3288 [Cymbomonas tetramitiformis]|uniref:Uncharacterized protein n=1 Tax=Cymbomonas tetramitiformis TaxID=36881 RepID=A0AAE0LLI8_9CHLO|nr:hypothetical protein CYMTET_3288 [Cymbomonas tetramitiformis]